MKKLFSLLLAVCLMFSLAAPTFAEGVYYEDWLVTWSEANPDLVDEILQDEPPLWQEYGYDSKEQMLSENNYSEDDYEYLLLYDRAWVYYADENDSWEEDVAKYIADWREEHGGEREGLGVMLNNSYIKFPDAKPELKDGRTMIPLRALMEALGATIEFADDGAVTCGLDGTTLSFQVGSDTVSATADGATTEIKMDCAPYIKGGRTYVPIRFFSEAVGLTVLWDGDYQTAVVLDRDAIVAEIDKNFTIINKVFASIERDETKTYKTNFDISANITMFSTLDGDATGRVDASVTIVSNGVAQNMNLSLDMASLVSMLMRASDNDLSAEDIAAMNVFLNAKVEMIVDLDKNVTYLKYPALMKELGYDQNAWVMIDDADIADGLDELMDFGSFGNLNAAMGYEESIGNTLFDSSMYVAETYDTGVTTYEHIMRAAEDNNAIMGDSRFTTSGSSHNLHIDRDTYERVTYGEVPDDESMYDYKEYDIRVTVTDNGNVSGSFTVRSNGYSNDARYTGTFSLSASSVNVKMDIHLENVFKVEVTINSSIATTTQTVLTAPPAGSKIIAENELDFDTE